VPTSSRSPRLSKAFVARGPGCDSFWCAPVHTPSRRHKRLRARLLPSVDMSRRDEGWTRLLKEGPGENARLFVDCALVRLPAMEVVRQFAHEGLRLSTPRAVVLLARTLGHTALSKREFEGATRGRPRECCRPVQTPSCYAVTPGLKTTENRLASCFPIFPCSSTRFTTIVPCVDIELFGPGMRSNMGLSLHQATGALMELRSQRRPKTPSDR
jgi:hypothetical protein